MYAGGVGPLPSRRSRRLPPVPGRGLPDLAYPPPPGARPLAPPFFCPLIACSTRSSLQLPSRAFQCVLDRHPDVLQGVPDGVRRSIVAAVACGRPLPQRECDESVDRPPQPVG